MITARDANLVIGVAVYPMSEIELVSIRDADGISNLPISLPHQSSFNIYLRTRRKGSKAIGEIPTQEEADRIAQEIAGYVQAYRGSLPAKARKKYFQEPLIAGNRIIFSEDKLLVNEHTYSLREIRNVNVPMAIPTGFWWYLLYSLCIFVIAVIAIFGLGWLSLQLKQSNDLMWELLRAITFVLGVGGFLAVFLRGLSVLPTVWSIYVTQHDTDVLVYKSENKRQIDRYARAIRRHMSL